MKANEIDLIPADFRRHLSVQRLLSNFLLVCVGLLGLIAAARMTLAYLNRQETALVVRLEQHNQTQQQSKIKTEELRQKKRVTEQQLSALEQLRGHQRVALFLSAIDQAYGQGIWFDSMHFMRRPGAGKLGNVPGAANSGMVVVGKESGADPGLDLTQGAEIVGHALNHTTLAEFMHRLGLQPGVADLRLVSTGTRSYTSVQVVDFNLTLQVDEKARAKP